MLSETDLVYLCGNSKMMVYKIGKLLLNKRNIDEENEFCSYLDNSFCNSDWGILDAVYELLV